MIRLIPSWIGGIAFIAALLGWGSLYFYYKGVNTCRAEMMAERLEAEKVAREKERELALISNRSAERIAEKEKALHDQAEKQNKHWKKLMASVPKCRVPAAVGVQLDQASGVSPATGVAPTPDTSPDGPALAAVIECAETLDVVRTNYGICLINANRLLEARNWYEEMKKAYEKENDRSVPE